MVTPLRSRLEAQVIGTCQVLRSWLRAGIIRDLDPFFVSVAEEKDNLKMAHMTDDELQDFKWIHYTDGLRGLRSIHSTGSASGFSGLDCNSVRRAVVRSDGILVGYLLAPIDKLLLLMSLALKYNPGFQKTAICCHGFDKVSLNAGLRAFEDGLPLRIATTDNQGIQA
ncbi:Speckle-type POZ protein-like B [Fusarium oxysporum f. sp. albedinis]|nr:Speckle-type POZ protein-like B [Fusarium oxysporum f. sp. albedinis]